MRKDPKVDERLTGVFFEHSDGETRPAPDEGARLIQAFLKIADPKIRALIVELTEAFTETKK